MPSPKFTPLHINDSQERLVDPRYNNFDRQPTDNRLRTDTMAYPPQRPPFEHQNSSTTDFSAGHGPGMPIPLSGVNHTPSPGLPYDPERANSTTSLTGQGAKHRKPHWGNSERAYSELDDSRSAGYHQSQPEFRLPDGEVPKTKVGKLYSYLLGVSIVTRWILFIVPVLGIVWIPGILGLTSFPNARVWGIKLIWWSIWLSVVWGGWWAALAVARVMPSVIRATIGVVAVSTRRYIDWMQALHRYIAIFAWTLAMWASFTPLISIHQAGGTGPKSVNAVNLIRQLLFSVFLCAAVLLFEKFSIQWIAGKFHERSYADRIADQKFAVKTLVTLYRNSTDIPGRSDTLRATHDRNVSVNPMRLFRKFREGVRLATTTTATVFGNVASEIAGSSVLQPNSPQAVIKTALESANKSRLLARRLFYSFAKKQADYLLVEDIERFFPTKEDAILAFALFDKDSNGDASREEIEMACLDFHREQLSIENSMRDLDSAVGRLDNIFMSVYVIIAALIIAIGLEAQVATLVTGAGTLILGLSWLIGGSLQEVLTSIIFLFIKHPYDVGDRVIINKEIYTVKEIRLLSTVFLDGNNGSVQAPNNQLNTQFIQNIRRSPQMSETFTFDVAYSTSFEDLEKLRTKMLEFVTAERRDYQPVFDVKVKGKLEIKIQLFSPLVPPTDLVAYFSIIDFPDQARLSLSADIKYKSNGQQAALKSKRRNKWICALKATLAEVKIYGPGGDPNPPPGVTRYTEVPWDLIQAEDRKKGAQKPTSPLDDKLPPSAGWKLDDKNAMYFDSADSVFGDTAEVHMTNPRRDLSQLNVGPTATQQAAPRSQQTAPPPHPADVFEMRPR
ncbi:hypothetical protein CPC08DRAFT_747250 [Agrocybe pediades]|nr:hypothetical protein CPC08DRAFT_747250 [Agrocybe pediades]